MKVIVVKLPFDLEERILAFPFLHALKYRYPEAEFHFITPKFQIEVLNLLPFKAFYHEFDEDEIKSIFDVHRFCVTAKIYKSDIFFNLTDSFPDALLGLGLKASERVGFSDGWKTMVLNQKSPRPRGHHICEEFLSLYQTHTGKEADPRLKVMSRQIDPHYADWSSSPYIAVDLAPLREAMIEEEWIRFFSFFQGQKFILFASKDKEKIQSMMSTFMAVLPPQNTYINFFYNDWIELAKVLAFARGVLAYQGPLPAFAAYLGARTLILYDRDDPQRTAPLYFLTDIAFLSSSDPHAMTVTPEVVPGSLRPRPKFNMEAVFEKAVEFFRVS
jgi:hypothetical protein